MNIGILGAGHIAATMAETIQKMHLQGEDVDLYAVASRDIDKARAFAARFQIHKAYAGYANMLEDSGLDLVYIATPHSHHYEHMLLCLKFGKAILCEKAFTANADQARRILTLSKLKDIPVTEAIWTRYMPFNQTIKNIIEEGQIGEPRTLTANLSYNIWQNERIHDPALAGGALLDVGVYTLNFADIFFGQPSQVQAQAVIGETGVDESDSITLRYPDGKMATLLCGTRAISDRQGIIHGDEGYLVVDNINHPTQVSVYDLSRQISKTIDAPEQISGYEYEVREMIQAVEEGELECPSMSHRDTIRMMELMDHIRMQTGVQFPFEKV
ncbi:MAG: Gfo/Idh/MocA family oxidoreductase [Lachnospiraceae bacterium]|nr:Gfo/Idh/MocA family oxidoreductase [Lachnospiraceae bacterium]MDD6449461.1 Gfo/Idh/MocA family oxidoreductase [Lachnospiraceae bacterium]MDD6578992.1 Gfo/Idh/MocA family oxidoreductase [Lachnospiraceae bacterium]